MSRYHPFPPQLAEPLKARGPAHAAVELETLLDLLRDSEPGFLELAPGTSFELADVAAAVLEGSAGADFATQLQDEGHQFRAAGARELGTYLVMLGRLAERHTDHGGVR